MVLAGLFVATGGRWGQGGWILWVFGGTHCYLLERLLSCVCADVVVERRGASKGPAAVSTFERSVAGVRHYMVPQL